MHVWKLNEEKTCEQYQNMVKDKVVEGEWKYIDMNEHWHQMKNIMMETAQVTADCIRTSRLLRIDEVAAALKKMKRHEAPFLPGLVAEMIQATGDTGTQWISDL